KALPCESSLRYNSVKSILSIKDNPHIPPKTPKMSMLRNIGVAKPLLLIALGSVYAAHLAQSATAPKAKVGNLEPEKVLEEASKDPSNFRVLDEGAIPGEEGKTVTYFWNVGAEIKIAFVSGDKA